MGIGRHIFGWHFTFPIAQPRDARALYGKWREGESVNCLYLAARSVMNFFNPIVMPSSSIYVP
jgi:hypothetical protein